VKSTTHKGVGLKEIKKEGSNEGDERNEQAKGTRNGKKTITVGIKKNNRTRKEET
jgi:hypothetical protein